MASNKTPNLGLDIWQPDDFFKRAEVNNNFTKLDDKIGTLQTSVIDNINKTSDNSNSITALQKNKTDWKNIREIYGAIGDGSLHPLNTIYGSQTAAITKYPFLTQWLSINTSVNWGTLEVDWCAINQAIADAVDGDTIYHPKGSYRVNQPTHLKAGVRYKGDSTVGYHNGVANYADVNDTNIKTTRIKATGDIQVGIFNYAVGTENKRSVVIENLILEGNTKSKNAIYIYGTAGSLKESNLVMESVGIQTTSSHGILLENVLTCKFNKLNIGACNGYGIKASYGFSDSMIKDTYIHTCQSGGISLSDGSSWIQITGGKIEDNYGYGVEITKGTVGCDFINIQNVGFHRNNKAAVYVSGSKARVGNSTFNNNGLTQTGANKCHVLAANGATLRVNDNDMGSGATYGIYSTGTNTKAYALGNDIAIAAANALYADLNGSIEGRDNILNGVLT
ncbi:right-handed parallel beta-helix repeat-containing protein [Priestia megaterium]|uniref:right-handed parallel beta-helix repeat-containing protein n=1 Tax=Priestia megaterium TaxID=1404 RepID=UPI00257014EC|nr:right-handed parallel beta-helix repeat-containing protein [Priestia megaterium]WJD81365.1 right-handed parallel beta-helix repeat-containing protein [Priestia megaterium]